VRHFYVVCGENDSAAAAAYADAGLDSPPRQSFNAVFISSSVSWLWLPKRAASVAVARKEFHLDSIQAMDKGFLRRSG
jgi:hypothetical protein